MTSRYVFMPASFAPWWQGRPLEPHDNISETTGARLSARNRRTLSYPARGARRKATFPSRVSLTLPLV